MSSGKSSLSVCPASLNNPASLCNRFCWSSLLYSVILMSFRVRSACRYLTFLIASPVWWVAWCLCLILSLCSGPYHSPWKLIPSKAGCSYLWPTWHAPWSLQPTESRAAVHTGHSKNWDKFIRCRTAFHSTSADLGPAKLHWLHSHRERAYSHIRSALLYQWLWDSGTGAAHGK